MVKHVDDSHHEPHVPLTSAAPAQRRHAVIAGTGRAGTSFLVRLFDACGLETGLDANVWFSRARAGYEHALDSHEPLPYVVKDPWLFSYCEDINLDSITIDALILPIRDLMLAARSRVHQERLAVLDGPLGGRDSLQLAGTTPGGVLYSLDVVDQARILAVGFHKLLHWAAANQLPLYLLEFPRLVEDPHYTLGVLWPWLGAHCTTETARRAFAEVADPDAARITSDPGQLKACILGEGEPDTVALDRAALSDRIGELHEQLRRVGDEAQCWCNSAAELESQAAEQAGVLEVLRSQLEERERSHAELDEIRSRLYTHERTVQSLEDEIRHRDEDLDTLHRGLAAVHASASWRVTAPLRAAKHGTRRLRPARRGSGIPARDQSLLAGWSVSQVWWFALILSSMIAATDAVLSHVVLIALLAAGPFCGLLTGRWARTASVGIWSVALAVLLGFPDEIWGTRTQLVDLTPVAAVALLSTFAATLIERRRYQQIR